MSSLGYLYWQMDPLGSRTRLLEPIEAGVPWKVIEASVESSGATVAVFDRRPVERTPSGICGKVNKLVWVESGKEVPRNPANQHGTNGTNPPQIVEEFPLRPELPSHPNMVWSTDPS